VRDTPREIRLRFRGRVEDKRPHRYDATERHEAIEGGALLRKAVDLVVGQHAMLLRTGQHAQRPVLCG